MLAAHLTVQATAAQQEAAAARQRGRAQHAVEAAFERAAQAGGALTLRSGRQVAGAGPSSMEGVQQGRDGIHMTAPGCAAGLDCGERWLQS
jgi:hypothetical protein